MNLALDSALKIEEQQYYGSGGGRQANNKDNG